MGSRGGGDGNPYFWTMLPGKLLLFPGDVSRHTTMNTQPADSIYISFDVEIDANAVNGAINAPASTPNNVHDAGDAVVDDADHVNQDVNADGAVTGAHDFELVSSAGETLDSSLDQQEVYTLSRRTKYNQQHSPSSTPSPPQPPLPKLAEVEDVSRWGTPIGLLRLPDLVELNKLLAADASRLDNRYGRRGNFAVFQSPNKFNLFEHTDEHGLEYPSVAKLRSVVRDTIMAYLGQTCDCATASGPSRSGTTCDTQQSRWQRWSERGKQLEVTSSWVNIAGKAQRSINQVAHSHLVYGTSVTGVYYAASGWSDAAAKAAGKQNNTNSTNIWLVRPTHLSSRLSQMRKSYQPTPGTLLIFPTFLHHLADIHGGDEDRISVAFNAV